MTKRIICVVLMIAVFFAAMLALGYFCPIAVSFIFAALAGVYVGNGIIKAAQWLTNETKATTTAERKQCPLGNTKCLCADCTKNGVLYGERGSDFCIYCADCIRERKPIHDCWYCDTHKGRK